jgi:hypothetical protein
MDNSTFGYVAVEARVIIPPFNATPTLPATPRVRADAT